MLTSVSCSHVYPFCPFHCFAPAVTRLLAVYASTWRLLLQKFSQNFSSEAALLVWKASQVHLCCKSWFLDVNTHNLPFQDEWQQQNSDCSINSDPSESNLMLFVKWEGILWAAGTNAANTAAVNRELWVMWPELTLNAYWCAYNAKMTTINNSEGHTLNR